MRDAQEVAGKLSINFQHTIDKFQHTIEKRIQGAGSVAPTTVFQHPAQCGFGGVRQIDDGCGFHGWSPDDDQQIAG